MSMLRVKYEKMLTAIEEAEFAGSSRRAIVALVSMGGRAKGSLFVMYDEARSTYFMKSKILVILPSYNNVG